MQDSTGKNFSKELFRFEFDRFLDDYRNGEDIIDPVSEREREMVVKKIRQKRSGQGTIYQETTKDYSSILENLTDFIPEQLIELVNSKQKGKKYQ